MIENVIVTIITRYGGCSKLDASKYTWKDLYTYIAINYHNDMSDIMIESI